VLDLNRKVVDVAAYEARVHKVSELLRVTSSTDEKIALMWTLAYSWLRDIEDYRRVP
jgi:hypothetical protein